MRRGRRRALLGAGALALVAMVASLIYESRLAPLATAYTAKTVCSGVFVSQRDPRSLFDTDLVADNPAILRQVTVQVDRRAGEVRASLFGFATRTAVYRDRGGCTVVHRSLPALATSPRIGVTDTRTAGDRLAMAGRRYFERGGRRVQAVVHEAFQEPDPGRLRRTRAVVVVHRGEVIAEEYGEGFTREMPLLGWSMTKSVINVLVGILVREGRVSLQEPVPIPAWQGAGDPRRGITWEHLLRMTSGLQFDESYSAGTDVTQMLFGASDMAAYAAAKPLAAAPGTRWSYSSGTTNILAYAIRRVVGEADYPALPRRMLFAPLAMTSAVLETDASGTFVGSSFMYATARDWARFGLLYLDDGVWAGRRLLPQGWVAYTRTATASAPEGEYGAHVWLRLPRASRCDERAALPADAFHAVGHDGQILTIIPSRKLVLVRLGLSRGQCAWDHQTFVHAVLQALDDRESAG